MISAIRSIFKIVSKVFQQFIVVVHRVSSLLGCELNIVNPSIMKNIL